MGSSLAALSAYGAASDSENSSDDEEGTEKNPGTLHNMINNMSKPIPVPPGTSPGTFFLTSSRFFVVNFKKY